jgi:uncharacterized membrane protein
VAGCVIQFPALLAVVLILIRGRYSAHSLIFWLVIILAVLATWSWSVERSGKRAKSERVAMVLELARNLAVALSWIVSVVGIVIAFV